MIYFIVKMKPIAKKILFEVEFDNEESPYQGKL